MVTRTDGGTLVCAGISQRNEIEPFTQEQAEADAKARNERAEALGIKTRYVVAEA